MSRESVLVRNSGRVLATAQLLRLPNVFTAFADIAMALAVVVAISSQDNSTTALDILAQAWPRLIFLLLCSGCLYLAGMVWNDIFDRREDAISQKHRPIASGRVSLKAAILWAISLTILGLLFAWFARQPWNSLDGWADSFLIAMALTVMILLYDAWLKRMPIGPIAMGMCRLLNVLLGLSIGSCPTCLAVHVASVIGIYIIGVTWFARTEEKTSRSWNLILAAAVMAYSLLVALAVPLQIKSSSVFFPYGLVLFAFLIGVPIYQAIDKPVSRNVQKAVKSCIFGLVMLDAILAVAFVGLPGLVIIGLLIPAILLGRKVYST
jgi:4-hydroxybenzoate polyprenyltransferase